MKNNFLCVGMPFFLILLLTVYFLGACKRSINFELAPTSLRFSADTVHFDTLLTTILSTTKRFRVYNDNPKAVKISKIGITNASNSFSIIVNGVKGNDFENTNLLAGDSLLILLKANLKEKNQDLPYVVEEFLKFSTNGFEQKIPVIAWGQDAHFLKNSTLIRNTVWKSGKPYVIYDNILIDISCKLTIEPGTRIFSHFGSFIYIKGTIESKGSAKQPILFTNDRFDNGFDNALGQWGGLAFLKGSKQNKMDFTHIKNAQNGISLKTPDDDKISDLVMTNCIIENMSNSGIIAFSSDLSLTNCLINNCAEYNMAGLGGGNYEIKHSTLANFGFGFLRNKPIMIFTNSLQLSDESVISDNLNTTVKNSIVWGNKKEEMEISNRADYAFNLYIKNNLLRTNFQKFKNENILNKDPLFVDPSDYNYRISKLSPAIDAGAHSRIITDLDSLKRDDKPDIGAYEWRKEN